MDSPSDSQVIRRRKGPAFEYLVPLIYAPVLPLIRIALRHKPVLRDRLFYGVLAGAFAHGTYLVYPLSHSSVLTIAYSSPHDLTPLNFVKVYVLVQAYCHVAQTLQKYRWMRVGYSKNSVFLENPTWVRQHFWRVGAT